jgi:hypothetical protein
LPDVNIVDEGAGIYSDWSGLRFWISNVWRRRGWLYRAIPGCATALKFPQPKKLVTVRGRPAQWFKQPRFQQKRDFMWQKPKDFAA